MNLDKHDLDTVKEWTDLNNTFIRKKFSTTNELIACIKEM